MTSTKFYPGDKVTFNHWSTDVPITGTIIKSYAALDSVYLIVRDSDGHDYHPDETRCSLVNKNFHVG